MTDPRFRYSKAQLQKLIVRLPPEIDDKRADKMWSYYSDMVYPHDYAPMYQMGDDMRSFEVFTTNVKLDKEYLQSAMKPSEPKLVDFAVVSMTSNDFAILEKRCAQHRSFGMDIDLVD